MTDTVKTILEEVEALVASFEKQRQELVEKLKPSFGSIFTPFFDAVPEVDALMFTAYTPYFNDGDECTFSVNDLYGYFTTTEEDEREPYEGDLPAYGPSPTELLAFRERGEISDYLKRMHQYETKPQNRYDHTTRSYKDFPAKFSSLEEAIKDRYKEELALPAETLKRQGEIADAFKEMSNLFHRIPDDIIRELFGDHIKVTITRDGVEVDEYEHD